MAYRDLREWIHKLEMEDHLQRVKAEVDWDLEIGAITRATAAQRGPALLFENIKGHQKTSCKSFFTNSFGSMERVAMAMGLDKAAGAEECVETLKSRLLKPSNTVQVERGSVQQHVIEKKEIDLQQLPVPHWHHRDGGRYINTLVGVVTRDPETKLLNVGTYRGMVSGKDKIPVLIAATQHWGQHFAKYRRLGQEMPISIFYGAEPTIFMLTSAPLNDPHSSEYEYGGSLRQQPLELVRCQTNDLLVPAEAEIVVEGRLSGDPKTFVMEGPFGEYPGTYGGMASPKPAIDVDCVTHRTNPILMGSLEGNSPGRLCESAYLTSVTFSAICWNFLEKFGVPNILGVWTAPVTCSTTLRVKIRKIYRGQAQQVANAIWASSLANYAGKNVIVTDEDIDIYNDEAMEWALAWRVNAEMGDVTFFSGTFGSMLDPSYPLETRDIRKYGQGKWTRVLIDATINWDLEPEEQFGGNRYPPSATDIDPAEEQLIRKRWKEYGFKEPLKWKNGSGAT